MSKETSVASEKSYVSKLVEAASSSAAAAANVVGSIGGAVHSSSRALKRISSSARKRKYKVLVAISTTKTRGRLLRNHL